MDLVDFSGPDFKAVDKRCVALRLVEKGLCDAALFNPSGECPRLCHPLAACICFPYSYCKHGMQRLVTAFFLSRPDSSLDPALFCKVNGTQLLVHAGKLEIPQEALYKKNVLITRGRFRPFTLLHNDMLMGAASQFFCDPDGTLASQDGGDAYTECVYRDDTLVLLELTTRDMMEVWTCLCTVLTAVALHSLYYKPHDHMRQ